MSLRFTLTSRFTSLRTLISSKFCSQSTLCLPSFSACFCKPTHWSTLVFFMSRHKWSAVSMLICVSPSFVMKWKDRCVPKYQCLMPVVTLLRGLSHASRDEIVIVALMPTWAQRPLQPGPTAPVPTALVASSDSRRRHRNIHSPAPIV